MSQKEKQSQLQLVQLVSSLMAGVILAFGVSVLLLFCAAHLAAAGKLGEGITLNAEVIASAVGCFLGSVYIALSYRRRILLLGLATGLIYYLVWTIIGIVGYTDVAILDGARNLIAALAGGGAAGFLCAGFLPKRK